MPETIHTTIDPQESNRLDILARRIRQGVCVLFLGPEVFKTTAGISFNEAFAGFLAEKLEAENISVDNSLCGNASYMIYYYLHEKNKKFGSNVIKMVDIRDLYFEFYKTTSIDDSLLKQLAALPFPLVINANTDDQFFNIFAQEQKKNKRDAQFDFYDMSNRETVERKKKAYQISQQTPLVYNLFGHCSEQHLNSLILSEKELINFVGSIHQANMLLPGDITKFIDQDKYCLFLGFDFNEWFLKILIRVLWNGEKPDDRRSLPDALALDAPSEYASVFYQNEFNFCFVNNHIEQFIQGINERILPKAGQPQTIVAPPAAPKAIPNVVFIFNYASREDSDYRNKISQQLRPLVSARQITLWSEDLADGSDKDLKRKEKFETCDMVIWLVSGDFIDAEKNKLVTELSSFNKKQHLKNIAVLVRPALYNHLPEMKTFSWQPLPDEGNGKIKAISQYTNEGEQEGVIVQLADYIVQQVEEIKSL